MANKYKNIIGTGLTDYVQEQINHRKEVTGNKNQRSPKELQWLTNRNSWFRLSSGAKFNPSPISVRYDKKTVDKSALSLESLLPIDKFLSPNLDDVQALDAGYTDDLAKKYILQGGTLKNGKRRTTFKDTYPKGNYDDDGNFLGTEASIKGTKDDLGYKPLPGITNVSVGTRGKWRTTLEADVDFVCYNLEQLEIMNKLYMSLGVHVFLEWGHTPYINSSGNIIESFNPINFFDNNFRDKKVLIQEIEKKKKEHHGNYGALLGRVYNFTYSSNPDGSYNCKAQVIGPGAILESIRVNRATMYDFDLSNQEDNSSKYDSDLANALTSIKNLLYNSLISFAEYKSNVGGNALGPVAGDRTIINGFGRLDASQYFKGNTSTEAQKPFEYGSLLKRIYGNCTYKGYDFVRNNNSATLQFPNGDKSFAAYGNAWQYVSNLSTDVKPLDINLFDGFATRFSKGGRSTQESLGGVTVFSDEDAVVNHQYIKLGHLLALIQHVCVFSEVSEGSVTINNNASSTTDYSPVVYIDFHPDNTIMKTGVLEATSDPSVCMIPLKINTKSNESENEAFDKFFTPLDTRKKSRYSWQDDSSEIKYNEDKNLIVYKDILNKINSVLDPLDNKLMNVLVNLKFAIGTLKSLENQNREVDFIELYKCCFRWY